MMHDKKLRKKVNNLISVLNNGIKKWTSKRNIVASNWSACKHILRQRLVVQYSFGDDAVVLE